MIFIFFSHTRLQNKSPESYFLSNRVRRTRVLSRFYNSKGEQEYLEQIGANPAKLQAVMRGFVEHETKCEDWST